MLGNIRPFPRVT